MNLKMISESPRNFVAVVCVLSLMHGEAIALIPSTSMAQAPAQPATQAPATQAAPTTATPAAVETAPKIPNDQLDSLVAPIALYPDPLLAQVLAASTYPLEIVQLQQWLVKNDKLKDKKLADAVAKQPWDPSIQGLSPMPDVVKRLADDIQWTTDLGNAFLAQKSDVMDAVQRMRKKAQDKGNLKTTEQQKVETQVIENKSVIVVEQSNPQVVYVPSYDPVVVYGAPIYPYPPIYYPPYYGVGLAVSFGVGLAIGAAWGGGWGYGCGWGGGDINVNMNNNFNKNNNFNRNNVGSGNVGNGNRSFQHNPEHRGGAPYSDRSTADKFGGTARGDSLSNRQSSARNQVSKSGGNLPSSTRPGASDRAVGGADRAGRGCRREQPGFNRKQQHWQQEYLRQQRSVQPLRIRRGVLQQRGGEQPPGLFQPGFFVPVKWWRRCPIEWWWWPSRRRWRQATIRSEVAKMSTKTTMNSLPGSVSLSCWPALMICAALAYQLVQTPEIAAQATVPAPPKAVVAAQGFATPEEALTALVDAAAKVDVAAVEQIFGTAGMDIVFTAEPARNRELAEAFVARAREKKVVEVDPKDKDWAVVSIGNDNFPFAVPLSRKGGKWFFDVEAGREELLYRRVGSNELDAIQICRGYVEAQHEYALAKHGDSKVNQYAQRIISTPGTQDGLSWKNPDGTAGGPVGDEIAAAIARGYTSRTDPYHGYFFKILKGQGPAAPLGEMDFVVKGAMIGGFALVAAPAEYAVTGVQTFMVSHDGVVYQKDLGPKTLEIFAAMERFNPDKTWTPVLEDN